jgi:TolB protein
VLDLRSQALTQLTNSGGYEGHPTWSPDGQWLAFEAYMDGNMEIIVRSLPISTPIPSA